MTRASMFAALAVCAAAVPARAQTTAQEPPSPIEQAVMEQRCSMSRVPGVTATDAYQTCLSSQIASLRSDFGVDLKKLTPAERKGLDALCSRVQVAEGRDAYVGCISRQLAALHTKRAGTAAPAVAPAPPGTADPRAPTGTPAASDSSVPSSAPPPAAGVPMAAWVGAAALVAALGGGVLMMRKRARPTTCRTCGAAVGGAGDMCPKCRHEAAEALRRAAVERDERQRALAEEERRRAAFDEEQRQARAHADEQAVREFEERMRQEAAARTREEEERRREEERRERARFGSADAEAFDPHAALGVAPGAPEAAIHAAYQELKAKYDPDVVAHLSEEVQAHYRTKAEIVERAYRLLSAS
jgi:hypothetical protein